ncbi:hypothetical protein I308_104696 [Cryptococcus tetragattii IND107]|uniref:Uncharacterized protein n=1 Tax=Cryptococcus tetragattii IND107 TaxID=1296105 RepID=A0ABR3BRP5_9TREE
MDRFLNLFFPCELLLELLGYSVWVVAAGKESGAVDVLTLGPQVSARSDLLKTHNPKKLLLSTHPLLA